MISNTKMLLFDLGGVIIDILPEKTIDEFNKISKYSGNIFGGIEYRYENVKSEISDIFFDFEKGFLNKEDFRNRIRKIAKIKIDDNSFDHIWNLLIIKINKNIVDLILSLNNKFSIMILSNTNEIHRNYFDKLCIDLYKKRFDELFYKCFYSFDLKSRKPDKEIYDIVIEKSGFLPYEITFFDDMDKNLVEPKKLGINTYHVTKKERLMTFLKSL